MTPEALGELYEAERGPLTRSVERITGNRQVAEDVVHDAFVAYLASSPGADRPGAWLSRVARNRALNLVRRSAPLPLVETAADEGATSETTPERDAVRAVVASALGVLHDRDRLALQSRFFEGLDYSEVAARLGVRIEQSHVIVHRAVRRLGREVVRRLAAAHDALECEPALARQIGLAGAGAHAEGPCGRCRPAWDELAALRSLPGLAPIAVGPGTLRRIIGRIWTRVAGLTDVASNVAGAAVGVAVVVSSVAPGGATAAIAPPAPVPVAEQRAAAPARMDVNAPAAVQAGAAEPKADAEAPLTPRGSNLEVGGGNVTTSDTHTQVEPPPATGDGGDAGIVVCKPLEPCPPPPSPGPPESP